MRAMFTPIFSPQWREYRDKRNPGLVWRILRAWFWLTALMVILTGVLTVALVLVTVWAFQWLYALIKHRRCDNYAVHTRQYGWEFCSCGWQPLILQPSFTEHRKPELFLMRELGAPGRALSKWMNR